MKATVPKRLCSGAIVIVPAHARDEEDGSNPTYEPGREEEETETDPNQEHEEALARVVTGAAAPEENKKHPLRPLEEVKYGIFLHFFMAWGAKDRRRLDTPYQ